MARAGKQKLPTAISGARAYDDDTTFLVFAIQVRTQAFATSYRQVDQRFCRTAWFVCPASLRSEVVFLLSLAPLRLKPGNNTHEVPLVFFSSMRLGTRPIYFGPLEATRVIPNCITASGAQ